MRPNNDTHRDTPILQVKALKKYFPVKQRFLQSSNAWIKALDGVDFTLPQGKTIGLVGESGCGKTTLGRAILKLINPDSGKIIYKGKDITFLKEKKIKPLRREMQIIFQDPYGSLNPKLTVGSIIDDGLQVLGLSKPKRRDRSLELMQLVGLPPEALRRYPHEFSGGQRQRIGLARALSVNPSLLVCDEPVSALDVSIQSQIINLLLDLQHELGLSYLFISHDLHVVGYISDWTAVMYLGQIIELAPTEKIFDAPLHPYTAALIAAAPQIQEPSKGLQMLTGEVPDLIQAYSGCRFYSRCPIGENACLDREIELEQKGNGRWVRCWKVH